jgi:hypothetical protein
LLLMKRDVELARDGEMRSVGRSRELVRRRRVLCVIALCACGAPDRPPNHPASGMRDRAAMRVELVALVVPDPGRAARVKQLYAEIDALGRELERKRTDRLAALRALDARRDSTDEALGAAVRALRADGQAAFQRYVSLQMQLREQLTSDEFARLDATR